MAFFAMRIPRHTHPVLSEKLSPCRVRISQAFIWAPGPGCEFSQPRRLLGAPEISENSPTPPQHPTPNTPPQLVPPHTPLAEGWGSFTCWPTVFLVTPKGHPFTSGCWRAGESVFCMGQFQKLGRRGRAWTITSSVIPWQISGVGMLNQEWLLGPPARCPFSPFLVGRVPRLK